MICFKNASSSSLVAKHSSNHTNINRLIRLQSSYSLLNTQFSLHKNDLKQGKKKLKHSMSKLKRGIVQSEILYYNQKVNTIGNQSEVAVFKSVKNDYSWLPKAPSTNHLNIQDISTDLFFSGYRPLSINADDLLANEQNPTTLYEISMSIDDLNGVSPWISSVTNSGQYGQWNSIPKQVLEKLNQLHPTLRKFPNSNTQENHEKCAVPQDSFSSQTKKSTGRKKPMISLLYKKKKPLK